MACLNLTELRSLQGAEKAFLENAARNIEYIVDDTKNSALKSGLESLLQNC